MILKEALLRFNAIQKEVTDTLDAVFDVLKERIRSAGYEHVPVDTENRIPAEYALKKA